MNHKDDGGPFHPVISTPGVTLVESNGISLRDWFAGQALSAWIASRPTANGLPLQNLPDHADVIAATAYGYADAMLAARKEKP